jgi:hypothetical protein
MPRDDRLNLAAAVLVTVTAGFVFLNGSLFSTVSSLHVDYSINYTAAHALRDGENPYGITTLAERAEQLDGPTGLIYGQLFTSYIQPPTSAIAITPLSFLPWRWSTRAWLLLNHAFLAAAVVLTLVTVRPALRLRWIVAGTAVILALYSQVYGSFALGQVDALQVFLLSLGLWAYLRNHDAVCGVSIACAAAIKLLPALLLLYFLWRRDYRVVLWGLGAGLALLLASAVYSGPGVYETYLTETVPALSKGSTHYSNAGLGAVFARASTPSFYRALPEMIYLDEVTLTTLARAGSYAAIAAGLATIAFVGSRRRVAPARDVSEVLPQYYFVVAAGLLISSVTWEFYVVWLLPVFLAMFLAPQRFVSPAARGWLLGALGLAFVALNYPGDMYLFSPNAIFYHPDWAPGTIASKLLPLYDERPDLVLYLRLPALLLTAAALLYMSLRADPHPSPLPVQGEGAQAEDRRQPRGT